MKEIKPLKRSEYPKYILYFDTETKAVRYGDSDIHTFYLGFSILARYDYPNGKAKYVRSEWYDKESFLNYLEISALKHKKLLFMAHNIFFDLQALGFFALFRKRGWKLNFIYDQGLTYILRCTLGSNSLTCISSTNYYKTGVKQLGDMVGLPKLEVDLKEVSDAELMTYCERDVDIVRVGIESYIDFIRDNGLGGFAMSLSGQALKAYRTKYMQAKIIVHDNDESDRLEKSGYFGGRCECFQLGKISGKGFITLDINSMYPYVMKKYLYPSRLLALMKSYNEQVFLDSVRKYLVMAKVVVCTDEPLYPVRYNGKVCFPVGEFETTLCTGSLQQAVGLDHLKHVIEYSVYQKGDLFTGYVDGLYRLRQVYMSEDNKIMVSLTKNLLNSLYGKFGQMIAVQENTLPEKGINYKREQILDMNSGRFVIHYTLLNTHIQEVGQAKAKTSFYAIAAHVTDYARIELQSIIKRVGWDNVLYCDTDCVKIEKSQAYKLKSYMDSSRLGSLKTESETDDLTIHGCKSYEESDYRKLKGVPKNAVQLTEQSFRYASFLGQTTHLRKGLEEGFMVRDVTKTMSNVYDKGMVDSKGRVKPFLFFYPLQVFC